MVPWKYLRTGTQFAIHHTSTMYFSLPSILTQFRCHYRGIKMIYQPPDKPLYGQQTASKLVNCKGQQYATRLPQKTRLFTEVILLQVFKKFYSRILTLTVESRQELSKRKGDEMIKEGDQFSQFEAYESKLHFPQTIPKCLLTWDLGLPHTHTTSRWQQAC